ncbi:MAG: YraN family protein [Candidatus Rokubacteria bacterium]|nr:YraN family protein [Candidatus Rokubacteria bacterium]
MGKRPTRPVGQLGEEVAARFLEARGFRILARNLRSRLGEIDLVARDGATLVFVEVKARRGPASEPPQVSVDGRKRSRLARLALDYLAREWLRDLACRFDVVAVTFDPGDPGSPAGAPPCVEHFPGAFAADGWTG